MWSKRKADSAVPVVHFRGEVLDSEVVPFAQQALKPCRGSATPGHPRTNPDPRDHSIALVSFPLASLLSRCERAYAERCPFIGSIAWAQRITLVCGNEGVQWTNGALLVSFLVLKHLFSISLEAEEEVKSCHCLMKAWPTVCYEDTMRPSNRNLLHKPYFGDNIIH